MPVLPNPPFVRPVQTPKSGHIAAWIASFSLLFIRQTLPPPLFSLSACCACWASYRTGLAGAPMICFRALQKIDLPFSPFSFFFFLRSPSGPQRWTEGRRGVVIIALKAQCGVTMQIQARFSYLSPVLPKIALSLSKCGCMCVSLSQNFHQSLTLSLVVCPSQLRKRGEKEEGRKAIFPRKEVRTLGAVGSRRYRYRGDGWRRRDRVQKTSYIFNLLLSFRSLSCTPIKVFIFLPPQLLT